MDFIERIFHLSPDHGDGSFEVLLLFALLFLLAFAILGFLGRARRHKEVPSDSPFRTGARFRPPAAQPVQSSRTG